MTRSSTKMANEFKNLLDDAVKSLASKEDIDSLKILIKDQSDTIKELGLKIAKLEEKVTTNEETIARLDERVSLLEGKIVYLETQDKLKARKLDDLQQYSHRESLRFNGFQTKQNEFIEYCEKRVKQFIRNTLKVEVDENYFNRIHRIGQKYRCDDGKECQQIIVKFKGFIPRTIVHRARKHKSDISVQLDLTKRRYDLLKEARTRIKGADSVEYAFADINRSLGLRLKNGRFKFFNSSEELDMALAEV